jgi:hypothetical protein
MTNDDKYKPTCLIDGDNSAFPIVIFRDTDIDQSTQLIYRKGQLELLDPSGIRLLDLTFWKRRRPDSVTTLLTTTYIWLSSRKICHSVPCFSPHH